MRQGNKTKPETIISILKTVEVLSMQGKTLDLACREVEITRQTYYKWRKEFGGMQVSQAKEMKKIKEEVIYLKKIIANLTIEKEVWKQVAQGK